MIGLPESNCTRRDSLFNKLEPLLVLLLGNDTLQIFMNHTNGNIISKCTFDSLI